MGSAAFDLNKTRLRRNHFSPKVPPHTSAEDNQVETVLGGKWV
jgi:hypothetical protein